MVLLIDAAPVGPDYLPGHAHADTLCFEMSLFGKRVFVNSGVSAYGKSFERLRQRGTAAHNTVVINGQNSSEVWGGFRVARRAQPKIGKVQDEGDHISIAASHDGYRHLRGGNTHIRNWLVSSDHVILEDEIVGAFDNAEARFHLHPDVTIDTYSVESDWMNLRFPQGNIIRFSLKGGMFNIEPSSWHPGFGLSEANTCIVVTFMKSKISTKFQWTKMS